jgi:hypothetical protein
VGTYGGVCGNDQFSRGNPPFRTPFRTENLRKPTFPHCFRGVSANLHNVSANFPQGFFKVSVAQRIPINISTLSVEACKHLLITFISLQQCRVSQAMSPSRCGLGYRRLRRNWGCSHNIALGSDLDFEGFHWFDFEPT